MTIRTRIITGVSVFLILVAIGAALFPESVLDWVQSFRGRKDMVAVVMENSHPSREYQRGFEKALMVEEYPVEGLISRFVLLFDAHDLPDVVGPVRSLRPYFVDGTLPYTHAILFAGGSPEAFSRAASHPEYLAINGLAYSKEFFRSEAPPPHNLFLSGASIPLFIEDIDHPVQWPPYRTGNLMTSSGAHLITVNFHSTLYNVEYEYSRLRNGYTRMDGGMETPIRPANVVFLEAPITGVGEHGRLTIPLSKGPMLLFRSGVVERGTWEKKGIAEPFLFKATTGKSMTLSPGQTWLTVVPALDRVSWE